jgi:hypothetical protein
MDAQASIVDLKIRQLFASSHVSPTSEPVATIAALLAAIVGLWAISDRPRLNANDAFNRGYPSLPLQGKTFGLSPPAILFPVEQSRSRLLEYTSHFGIRIYS